MLIEIEKIKVTDRIRKDFGNIQELADDIKENGLINPPVITPDTYELIAGERRLRAMKLLGYQQIEVRPMSIRDALHQLKLEISENENRKDFSFNEKMAWADMLKDEYSKIAKENQGKRNDLTSDKILSNVDTNKQVAEEVGFGNKETYRQAKYIKENANEELIKQLDEGTLSINGAYKKLKQEKEEAENQILGYVDKLKEKENEIEELKSQPKEKEVIDNTDYYTINQLKKQIENLQKDKNILEKKVDLNEDEANKFKKLKSDIEFLTQQKSDLSRKITSATELAGLTVELQNVLENKLAPIKFKRCIETLETSDVAVQNLEEVISSVDTWSREMKQILYKDKYVDVVDIQ